MAVLSFVYHMEMHYEEMVRRCCFTMKCIPREDKRQRLREIEIALLPDTEFSWGEENSVSGSNAISISRSLTVSLFSMSVEGQKCLPGKQKRKNRRKRRESFAFPMENVCRVPGFGSTFLLWIFPAAKMIYPCAG